MQVKVHVQ